MYSLRSQSDIQDRIRPFSAPIEIHMTRREASFGGSGDKSPELEVEGFSYDDQSIPESELNETLENCPSLSESEPRILLGGREFRLVDESVDIGSYSKKCFYFRSVLRFICVAALITSAVIVVIEYKKNAEETSDSSTDILVLDNVTVITVGEDDDSSSKLVPIITLVTSVIALAFDFGSEAKAVHEGRKESKRVSPVTPPRKVLVEVLPETPLPPVLEVEDEDDHDNISPSSQFGNETPDDLISLPGSVGGRASGFRSPNLLILNSKARRKLFDQSPPTLTPRPPSELEEMDIQKPKPAVDLPRHHARPSTIFEHRKPRPILPLAGGLKELLSEAKRPLWKSVF